MSLFQTLKDRGYLYQTTNEEEVKKLLDGPPSVGYVGIDPTADSLHIGHCLPLIMAKHIQDAGHKLIIVLGGATAMIGDPSGKSDMRAMVGNDFVESNRAGIEKAISKFIKLDGKNPAIVVNNADWFKGYDYIDFMRDIGVHFNVNKMLSCDAYKSRLENGGLTFFEMGYMLMQAYDFVYLNKTFGCRFEFGGSDQWVNILAGADLGRKLAVREGKDAETFQAFTNVLLLNADGVKMGKTVSGAVWVDDKKMPVFDFYQYFYNTDDRDAENFLKLLTYLSLDEISEIMKGDIREAKKRMAYEVTKLVHGKEKADEVVQKTSKLFSEGNADGAPEYKLRGFSDGINICTLLCDSGLMASKSEARRMIEQGAVYLNGEKITSFDYSVSKHDFKDGFALLKKGKKNYVKVVICD